MPQPTAREIADRAYQVAMNATVCVQAQGVIIEGLMGLLVSKGVLTIADLDGALRVCTARVAAERVAPGDGEQFQRSMIELIELIRASLPTIVARH